VHAPTDIDFTWEAVYFSDEWLVVRRKGHEAGPLAIDRHGLDKGEHFCQKSLAMCNRIILWHIIKLRSLHHFSAIAARDNTSIVCLFAVEIVMPPKFRLTQGVSQVSEQTLFYLQFVV